MKKKVNGKLDLNYKQEGISSTSVMPLAKSVDNFRELGIPWLEP